MKEKAVDEKYFPDGAEELRHEGDAFYLKVFLSLFVLGACYLFVIFAGFNI